MKIKGSNEWQRVSWEVIMTLVIEANMHTQSDLLIRLSIKYWLILYKIRALVNTID